MGMLMAMNLLKLVIKLRSGIELHLKQLFKEAGAYVCSELEQVGKDVEFLICMLSDLEKPVMKFYFKNVVQFHS